LQIEIGRPTKIKCRNKHQDDSYLSSSRFRTQHDGIRSVVNSSCNIAGFGTGRGGGVNHRFQHLSGNHDRAALLSALINNLLLQNGDIFGRAFDTQISTSHHDTLTESNNFLKIVSIKTRWLLNLGHDTGSKGSCWKHFVNEFINLNNIIWLLNKGKSDPIDTNTEHVFQITAILGSEWADCETGIGSVNTLAVANLSSDIDSAIEKAFALANDGQFDLAVVDHEGVADFTGFDNLGVRELNAGGISEGLVRIESKGLTLIQRFTLGVGEFTNLEK
jgi:hypothetical protein